MRNEERRLSSIAFQGTSASFPQKLSFPNIFRTRGQRRLSLRHVCKVAFLVEISRIVEPETFSFNRYGLGNYHMRENVEIVPFYNDEWYCALPNAKSRTRHSSIIVWRKPIRNLKCSMGIEEGKEFHYFSRDIGLFRGTSASFPTSSYFLTFATSWAVKTFITSRSSFARWDTTYSRIENIFVYNLSGVTQSTIKERMRVQVHPPRSTAVLQLAGAKSARAIQTHRRAL